MAIKIDSKIVGYKVLTDEEKHEETLTESSNDAQINDVESMHENLERPEMLLGSTYKIKTPQSEHALYITINDMILNMGTEHEERRPYEVFINSKNMEHFQWVLALTRVISAVFRKGGDACFLVEELKAVFDPKGGYFKKGGIFMPSLVAEIGCAIESHMKFIGMLKENELDEHQKKLINAKRKEFEEKNKANTESIEEDETSSFPEKAQLCTKCQTKALVLMDGCMTCLNCGDSKCG
ncbi:MAG: NrdJb [gamma proteobacterium symbiont of Bathyaustriella thionipta]|nr:NrdJb [gamma proteobacterium symbiont of Bathyaustriella thionipta]MCU7950194.1 NrdJb [gamma proteobacterium symbiont of Bathyaustriella thionipta]MCU7954923.1 NrdJb [gamma proteobacterium symbiont of Bathyaustriella thionipta]MCU7957204.1 NrdJb [gamma proteobacterium symbiont of Bathyaustriella thionipta]MCU7967752.1 NrdJb [gamma proteobacterium symbiont of Bathyaustriella thionipta]